MEKSNKEKFIKKAKQIHGDKYDYSLVEYKNNQTKVKIICPEHGLFEQSPSNHYKGECLKCSYDKRGKNQRYSYDTFKQKMFEIHGNNIDLTEFIYTTNKQHGICICNNCNYRWSARPDTLLQNRSHCPNCSVNAIYTKDYYIKHNLPNHSCYLYLVLFTNQDESFVKIGISKDVNYRFREKLNYNVQIINSYLTDFFTAYDLEQSLLKKYVKYRYIPLEKFKGHTECLDKSIYNLLINEFNVLVPTN